MQMTQKNRTQNQQNKVLRRVNVYVNLYDLTPFNSILGKCGIGAYHTGIQINDMEFCYGVVDENPNSSGVVIINPQSADYTFAKKIFLGELQISDQTLKSIIEQLSKKFNCGSYNLFKCNCNHFSQEMVKRLLGIELPKWIFRSTNILSYLCCCLPNGLVSGQWALQQFRQAELRLLKEENTVI